jgi:hypothetical protein
MEEESYHTFFWKFRHQNHNFLVKKKKTTSVISTITGLLYIYNFYAINTLAFFLNDGSEKN